MLTIKRLYELADQWRDEQLKTCNHSWDMIAHSDWMVVMKFLKFVWAHEDDKEPEEP